MLIPYHILAVICLSSSHWLLGVVVFSILLVFGFVLGNLKFLLDIVLDMEKNVIAEIAFLESVSECKIKHYNIYKTSPTPHGSVVS
jgi:hypothetical protein